MNESLRTLDAFSRCGDLRGAAAYIEGLGPARHSPRVALRCARLRVRQGYVEDAVRILKAADTSRADPALHLVLRLEQIAVSSLGDFRFAAGVAQSESLFNGKDLERSDAGDLAQASSLCARIACMAFVYYEIDDAAGALARTRMEEAAQILEANGRIEEALTAYHNHAVWPRGPAEARLASLPLVEQRALRHGFPARAADALLALADTYIGVGAEASTIASLLLRASEHYASAGDAGGAIHVARREIMLLSRRGEAGPNDLLRLVAAYDEIDCPREAISVLLDVSSGMLGQGDTVGSANAKQTLLDRVETTGLKMAAVNADLALADMHMRNRRLSDAIDVCLANIETPAPRLLHGQFRQLLGTAYAFAGDDARALELRRAALKDMETIGALDLASTAATLLANQLLGHRTEAAWREVRDLCASWLERNERAGSLDDAMVSLRLAVEARWQQSMFGSDPAYRAVLLDECDVLLDQGQAIASKLVPPLRYREFGGLAQLRGQIRAARGVNSGLEAGIRNAIEHYAAGGFAMEAANSRYLLGVTALNATVAARRTGDHAAASRSFEEGEQNFNGALAYYDRAGLLEEAANARFMLARHYLNLAPFAPAPLVAQIRAASLTHIDRAWSDLDSARRHYASGGVADVHAGKLGFSQKASRLVQIAMECLVSSPEEANAAWAWVQRGKSRALSDLLGAFALPPRRMMEALETDPDEAPQLASRRDLRGRLRMARPDQRPALRATLDEMDENLQTRPKWRDYLQFARGTPLQPNEVGAIFQDGATRLPGACVDWLSVGQRIYVMVARPDEAPRMAMADISLAQVDTFARTHLGSHHYRHTLRDMPQNLDDMSPLLSPLMTLTRPEELLIFCPTGPLNALPLHALKLGGAPIIARNPILYTHSHGMTRHAVSRRGDGQTAGSMTVFATAVDRQNVMDVANGLKSRFGARLTAGEDMSAERLVEALRTSRFVHYQGHAIYKPGSPLESGLRFGGEGSSAQVSVKDILDFPRLQAELFSMGACESAMSAIQGGDEPLGIAPALLLAGVGSVVGALWPVSEASSAVFMERLYERLADPGSPLNKAEAMRAAARSMIGEPDFGAPYHWAPYVLFGDWR